MLLEEAGELCSPSPGELTAGHASRHGTAELHMFGELVHIGIEQHQRARVNLPCVFAKECEQEYGVMLV